MIIVEGGKFADFERRMANIATATITKSDLRNGEAESMETRHQFPMSHDGFCVPPLPMFSEIELDAKKHGDETALGDEH